MNRIIKYRCWDGEKMWNVIAMHFHDNDVDVELQREEDGKFPKKEISYQKENLMQFTGLLDKNGKEIYEGDVVDIPNFNEKWKRGEPQGNWKRFKVEWNQHVYAFNNEWIYKPLSSYDTGDLMPYEIEVIGNIYENPNLLTES